MIQAECDGCGKRYKVPAAGKVYPCKACGGEVRGREEAAALLDDMPECAGCGALNPAGSSFCEECGAKLEAGAAGPRAGGPAGQGAAVRGAARARSVRRRHAS